ncbi:hypothetical protein WJX73_005445 [Symbiochloris irregularis]|uniref:Uncharacterized protein n=1 Tax=Symbiochloris irregularis TaxID=706552 RepID=A0AAW1Q049_9CHLO
MISSRLSCTGNCLLQSYRKYSRRLICTAARRAVNTEDVPTGAKAVKRRTKPSSTASRRLPATQGTDSEQEGPEAHSPEPLPSVLLGIDPDTSGAVAVLSCGQLDGTMRLSYASLDVHDMPTEQVQLGQGASQRMRRQADAQGITQLLQSVLAERQPHQVHACLEEPVCNAISGKFSWFNSGLAYGMWRGALAAHGISVSTVNANAWKSDLQLRKKGKTGSRELALQLFPDADAMLRRMKDHGRAEAMLIAAWRLGSAVVLLNGVSVANVIIRKSRLKQPPVLSESICPALAV